MDSLGNAFHLAQWIGLTGHSFRLTLSLIRNVTDYICTDFILASKQLFLIDSFRHFLRGFLNVIQSVAPDLHINLGFGVSLSSSAVLMQLQNYLTSHGIRRTPALRLLRSICETKQPAPSPSATGSRPQTASAEHSVSTSVAGTESRVVSETHAPLATVTVAGSGDVDRELVSSTTQDIRSEPESSPLVNNTSVEGVPCERVYPRSTSHATGAATRNDTLLGELTGTFLSFSICLFLGRPCSHNFDWILPTYFILF